MNLRLLRSLLRFARSRVRMRRSRLLEAALAARVSYNEDKYRLLMEGASDAISISDGDGNILEVNPRMCELLGYSEDEFLSLNVRNLIVTEELAEPLVDFAKLRSGRAFLLERPLRRKDGTSVSVEVSTRMLGDGRLLAIVRDITERKRAEEALRASEEELRALVEASPLAIVALDLERRVTRWNQAAERILGWRSEEVLGRPNPIVPAHKREEFGSLWERTLAGEALVVVELEGQRKDGATIHVSVSTAAVYGPAGEPSGVLVLIEDVSERKRTEERLRQTQRLEAVGRLAGGIAHDFNNLLSVIMASSELLLGAPDDMKRARARAQDIRRAAQRAASLTRQLLAFSRRQVLQPYVFDLNGIVADTEAMLRRVIGEDIELASDLASDLWPVKADPTQIEQVLMNLAVNARDAMPDGGRLTIETANVELDQDYALRYYPLQPGSYVRLSVADTGTGMDEETQARVFEPFFTTKEPGEGTGLGLATVYGIVKQSGGYIWVHSEPGKGAAFAVYLPRADEPLPPHEPTMAVQEARGGTETVLLVENDGVVRGLVRELLERHGYRVLAVGDGSEALAASGTHTGPIDVLLTDLVLPGMNGRELASRLTTLRGQTRVVYMSGYTEEAVFRTSILEPGAAFVPKPFTVDFLLGKLRAALDSRAGLVQR